MNRTMFIISSVVLCNAILNQINLDTVSYLSIAIPFIFFIAAIAPLIPKEDKEKPPF